MKIKNSELKFEDFKILASTFATVQTEEKIPQKSLNEVPIEIDFDILFENKNGNKFKVLIQVESNNNEKPKPGYLYSVICEAKFYLKGLTRMPKEKKDQYLLFTALPFVISMVRSHLYNLSAMYPYGQYLLPSIDLMELIKSKSTEVKKNGNKLAKTKSDK